MKWDMDMGPNGHPPPKVYVFETKMTKFVGGIKLQKTSEHRQMDIDGLKIGVVQKTMKNTHVFNQQTWDLWVVSDGFSQLMFESAPAQALRNNVQGPFSLQEMCLGKICGCGERRISKMMNKSGIPTMKQWDFERNTWDMMGI